jgi:hypothetical protein
MPSGKLVKIGIWENSTFIGCIIYGKGSIHEIGSPYGLSQENVSELVRVAIKGNHFYPVSKYLSISLKMLKKLTPLTKVIVSYADPKEGHHGGIYQATNWTYEGKIEIREYLKINGSIMHPRSVNAKYGTSSKPKLISMGLEVEGVKYPGKHKYSYYFDKSYMKQFNKPYPKRIEHESNASNSQLEESGAVPTDALHLGCKK